MKEIETLEAKVSKYGRATLAALVLASFSLAKEAGVFEWAGEWVRWWTPNEVPYSPQAFYDAPRVREALEQCVGDFETWDSALDRGRMVVLEKDTWRFSLRGYGDYRVDDNGVVRVDEEDRLPGVLEVRIHTDTPPEQWGFRFDGAEWTAETVCRR